MVTVSNLSKKFKKFIALDNVNCEFTEGVYGLLGSNGAGKTTLIRCILNLYSNYTGDIQILGNSINKNNKILLEIGYLPQNFGLFKEFKVIDMLKYMCSIKEIDKSTWDEEIDRVLKLVNLESKKYLHVEKLSGGMIRRLGIAQALLNDPKIIIFDEPTAGLDPEERIRFKNIINTIKKEKMIIISTHIVPDVQALCDNIVVMDCGKIISNETCAEIENKAQDKVYEISKKDITNIKSDYYIVEEYEKEDEIKIRIIAKEKLDYKKCIPTVEDGYLCLLKNI